jgi:uncharacterized protein YbaR (Trm112 family)
MRLDLVDHLICPRCDPEQSLVLLVVHAEERRVRRGWLGCPRCRTDYPIEEGCADLRADPAAGAAGAEEVVPYAEEELPLKVAALVGVTAGPAFVYAAPALAAAVEEAARLVPGVEWVTSGGAGERPGVSRVRVAGPRWPFARARLRGAALVAPSAAELAEAARVLWPGARCVAFAAEAVEAATWERAGFEVTAREGGTVVARRRYEPPARAEG